MHAIKGFDGRNWYLSNFYPSPITILGLEYPTVEHAYQAHKALLERDHEKIRTAPAPNMAKRLGRTIQMRPDWEQIKYKRMEDFIRLKFENETLASKLRATGDVYIEETNTWKDVTWGVCNGKGLNWLGIILMQVRAELSMK